MPLRTVREIPKTQARQRWAAIINVGLDLEDVLGLPSGGTDVFLTGAAAANVGASLEKALLPVGTVESVDFQQRRAIKQRYAFNSNPLVAFQTVPQQVGYTVVLSRVCLKQLPEVEAVLNFLPSNLVLQQVPFILELKDVGDGTPNTEIRHLIFGCWFSDSKVHYDSTSKDDTKLIQSATLTTGRVLTFDQSNAGNPAVSLASSVFTTLLSGNEEVQNVIDKLQL